MNKQIFQGKERRRLMCRSAVTLCPLALSVLLVSSVLAQVGVPGVPVGVGGGSGVAETSRFPLNIKLTGILKPPAPKEDSLAVVTLGNSVSPGETYQFEVVKAEAVGNPQVSSRLILLQTGRHLVDFNLAGPKELVSKVGQSLPGTPIALTGAFQQRNRKLTLSAVDMVSREEVESSE